MTRKRTTTGAFGLIASTGIFCPMPESWLTWRRGYDNTSTAHSMSVSTGSPCESVPETRLASARVPVPRHCGVAAVGDGFLVARYYDDQIRLARLTRSGVTEAEVCFHASDGEVGELDAAAFVAVAEAWSRINGDVAEATRDPR